MKYFCKGKHFVDEYGRVRMFFGVNIVDKSVTVDENGVHHYNFAPTDEELEALSQMGMNIVRLGLTWAGVQPEPDKIDYNYLDEYKQAVRKCNSHGLTVYVDFHQDLYSKFVSQSGDGAPKWACEIAEDKTPKKTYVIWAEDYFFNRPVHKSFDNFWNGDSFVQKKFVEMLEKTAAYLLDCDIAAYDVFNEPFPGSPAIEVAAKIGMGAAKTITTSKRVDRVKLVKDVQSGDVFKMLEVIDDPKVMSAILKKATPVIQKFDREKYIPFLRRCEEAIRKGGYEGIIFAENCYFSNLGIPTGTEKISERMAFAPHGYDITVDTPLTNTASPDRVDFIFDEHKRTQERLNVPVLVGEWGGMVDGSDEYPALKHLIGKFDKNYWSSTYWHFMRNMHKTKIMQTMCRCYPVAVAGTPDYFDNTPGRFSVSYTGCADCKEPTEIYLAHKPEKVYSTAPYKIEGNRLYADAIDGKCVIVVEYRP